MLSRCEVVWRYSDVPRRFLGRSDPEAWQVRQVGEQLLEDLRTRQPGDVGGRGGKDDPSEGQPSLTARRMERMAERVAHHRGLLCAWSASLETHCFISQKKSKEKQIKKQSRATEMERTLRQRFTLFR